MRVCYLPSALSEYVAVTNTWCTGEGKFESEAATPANGAAPPADAGKKKPGPKGTGKTGRSNKKKTTKERLQMVGDMGEE